MPDVKTVLFAAYIALCAICTLLVMAHSGSGTGMAASVRDAVGAAGAAVSERNLNRITAACIALLTAVVLVLDKIG